MVNVTPPFLAGIPLAPASPVATTVGLPILKIPNTLQSLDHSIQISATPAQILDNGVLVLSTSLGRLSVLLDQLSKDIPQKVLQQLLAIVDAQRPLTVTIQPGSPPTQAVLLVPTSNTAPTPSPSVPVAEIPPVARPLTAGTVLPAVVLPNIATSTNNTATIPVLIAANEFESLAAPPVHLGKTTVPLSVATITSPAQSPVNISLQGTSALSSAPPSITTTAPLSATPQTAAPPIIPPITPPTAQTSPTSQSTAQNPSPPVPPTISSVLVPGTEINLRIVTVTTPNAPPPQPTLLNQIVATVTGQGTNGQLILSTENTVLLVKANVTALIGTNILFSTEPVKTSELLPLPHPTEANFDSLPQILAALNQIDPQQAQQVFQNIVPQPNEALGGALLLIMNAFGQGDVRSWLGNNSTNALTKNGKVELIARLAQQFSAATETAHDPVVGSWKSYAVPLHTNNQFQTINFYVHNEQQRQSSEGNKTSKLTNNAVRFVIDMKLTRLGALQLDGLSRPKMLDMIVRSERPLPEGLAQELRQTYIETLNAVGFSGTLNLQIGRQNWVAFRKVGAAGNIVL
jgi:hypothetical protein